MRRFASGAAVLIETATGSLAGKDSASASSSAASWCGSGRPGMAPPACRRDDVPRWFARGFDRFIGSLHSMRPAHDARLVSM